MIKRISFVMVSIFVLLALDVRPGSQYAAQPQSQAPEYVSDEIIVKFREGVGRIQKGFGSISGVRYTQKGLQDYTRVGGCQVVSRRLRQRSD